MTMTDTGLRPPAVDSGPGTTMGDRRGGASVAAVVLVAGLAGAGGWGFRGVFDPADLLPVVAVAAVVPVLLSVLTRKRPLWLSLLAQVAVWSVTVSATLFHATALGGYLPSPEALSGIVSGLLNSWRALLTTIRPAPGEPRLLVVVHFLVWLAALAGAEIVLRSRTRVRALPALPALAVFAIALPFGVDGQGSVMPVAGALVALVAALAIVGGDRGRVRVLAGVPVAAVLGLVGVLLAPLLPIGREPYDPRTLIDQPAVVPFDSVSPLDRVSAWLQVPTTPLFTVKASRPEYWRLAVLDRYDGVRWSSSARFQTTGGRVPSGPYRGRYELVEQTVTLEGLPGSRLPAADRPVAVSGIGVAVDGAGSLLATAREGTAGRSYRVTSHVPRPTTEQRREAVPAGAPPALPPKTGVLRSLAQRVTRNARSPYQQASLLEHYLRTSERYDVKSPPGHALAALEYFLRTTHSGTSEQFAASFALLARTLGLPSRVVVGFRPGTPRDGTFQVLSGDVLAWPEIEFEDLGWMAFDPTPERSGPQATHDVVSTAVKERRQLAEQIGGTSARKPGPSVTPAPGGGDDAARSRGPSTVLVMSSVVGVALLLYMLAVAVVPVLRRGRRRRGSPEERVLGAWRQVCEDLGLAGETSLTASEVSERAVRRVGPEISAHIVPLGELLNFVEFAGRKVGPEAAEEAWRRSDEARRLLRRGTPPLIRVARRLHPRSLRRGKPAQGS
ncbi:DUF3488 and transglutaminase-like domain-containing protein [Sphaerisporangium sp. NPDC088356]|uniref:transglutaminase family protein n=1 Tax=Sphaerisporangium sp. NPDC088356 TaxID=3154871 RepID=UPI00341814F7